MSTGSWAKLTEFGLTKDDVWQEIVARDLVSAAGGRIVGKIKIQKIVYILLQMGLAGEFKYSYHHYGPYSEDLADTIESAKVFGFIREDTDHRQLDGARYSIFYSTDDNDIVSNIDFYQSNNAGRYIKELASQNSTVLELAATIHWLINIEKIGDWEVEIVNRKGAKIENGRLEKAVKLLQDLGLH